MLCLGMQEVSDPSTFRGGIQGWNIRNDADRDVTCTFKEVSERGPLASVVVNLHLQQSDGFEVSPGSLLFDQRKKIKFKIPRSLCSCNGYIKEGSLNVLFPSGRLGKTYWAIFWFWWFLLSWLNMNYFCEWGGQKGAWYRPFSHFSQAYTPPSHNTWYGPSVTLEWQFFYMRTDRCKWLQCYVMSSSSEQ